MRKTETVNTRYGNMLVFSDDPTIGRSLKVYGEYCYPEIELIKQFLTKDSFVIDVGANIGTHCIPLAVNAKTVIAFEPDTENHDLLVKNVSMQHKSIARKININKFALSNIHGKTDTLFDYGKTRCVDGDSIIMTQLDNIKGFPQVDFIKIDVEGMEYNVLQGAQETIRYFKPAMFIEMQDESMNPFIFDFLSSMGYNMYWAPCATYNSNNHNKITEDVFGRQHGVLNWLCTQRPIRFDLQPVTDRTDTIEKATVRDRRREND